MGRDLFSSVNDGRSPPSKPPHRVLEHLDEIHTTEDIPIPSDPLNRVIGQEKAIEIARIAAYQHRHLLLVGPPGIGKSMTAQALALHLERPTQENPHRPQPRESRAADH